MPLDPQVVAVTIRSYYAGVHETSIVENVRSRFGCSERTVRRCIAGLNSSGCGTILVTPQRRWRLLRRCLGTSV